MTKRLAAAALTTVVAGSAIAFSTTAHAAPAVRQATTCSLSTGALTATARPDVSLNERFATLGNTGGQWVGGDSTYSVPTKDGSIAWLFSDTLYGRVTDQTLSPTDSSFINNSAVIDNGRSLSTVTGGTPSDPKALIGPDADGSWYWLGDGTLQPNGRVQVVGLHFARFGTGIWDWGWTDNVVATFDRSFHLLTVQPLPSSANVQWGSWIQRHNGYSYVYGVEDMGATKYMHIARVRGNDLSSMSHWSYWTGTSWSETESDSARVMSGVANEYSVQPYGDGYLLITHDTNELFSNKILGYTSCAPTGPFVKPVLLYTTPETGAMGSYKDPNVWTYNSHEHPELRAGNRIVVSYNVNSLDSSELYKNVTIYRPRFIAVTLAQS